MNEWFIKCWWKSYISNFESPWRQSLKWHPPLQLFDQLEWGLKSVSVSSPSDKLSFCFCLPIPLSFHSVLPHQQCSLIIFQTATSLSVCFGKGLHTQRTVCLNLMTKTAERSHPTLSHPLTQHDSGMTTLTPQSELCPFSVWGCDCLSKCIPEASIPFLFSQKAHEGLACGRGVW